MFFLDFFGNRILMAVIASIHVFINHPFAVGIYPLLAIMEWWGHRTGKPEWDELARKVTFVVFIITTTVGAMTGVGIWLTAALIAPFGIGSLLRVFFWAWFIEWLVFISEVILVVVYYLTWKRWSTGAMKKLHIGTGFFLAIMSWFTMAIIVAILGFMMDVGTWGANHSFFSAIMNPIYAPQLIFRTSFAMITAGLTVWFLTFFFSRNNKEFRSKAIRFVAGWILVWVPIFILGSVLYYRAVPDWMLPNIPVGLLTQRFMQWYGDLRVIMAVMAAVVLLIAIMAAVRPKLIPRLLLIIPFVIGIYLLGHFERVREFVRKPYVIADYMYSNGVKTADLPIYQRDGILKYCTYVKNRTITSENKVDAGRDIFMVACSRCHTTYGLNGMVTKFTDLYGNQEEWNTDAMAAFISTMHTTRTYMPPFPGNDAEAEALVAYLKTMQHDQEYIFSGPFDWTVNQQTTTTAAPTTTTAGN